MALRKKTGDGERADVVTVQETADVQPEQLSKLSSGERTVTNEEVL